jgi:hypothetical protein
MWSIFGDWTLPVDYSDGEQAWLSAALQVLYLTWINILLLNLLIVRDLRCFFLKCPHGLGVKALILLNIRKESVCMREKNWRYRA